MGQPRASRRKAVTISSDDENDAKSYQPLAESSEDEKPSKGQKRASGKLTSPKKFGKPQQPTPTTSSTQEFSSQKSPAKSKVSKPKSKTAVKDQPRPNAKPIYSFFNAATQRLQNPQPSASPEKLSTQQEEPETIQDDSEDAAGSGVQLSKGSSTALALRKRKVQDGNSFDQDTNLFPQASQKFRKAANGDRVPSFSSVNEEKRPWTEQFTPKDLTELAIHKRKVSDVRQWLEMTLNGHRQRVLVLKGAAGTGKTTTIRLLAKDLGLEVSEWKNPVGADLAAEGSVSAALQFEEFVGRAGRIAGLTFVTDNGQESLSNDTARANGPERSGSGQLLLIEEFPNTFSRSSSTLQSFRSAILQFLSSPISKDTKPTPVVLVISETLLSTNTALADSFTAHRLLGPELSNHPFLNIIEFNAVAQTFLLKALETVVLKEARKSGRRRTPGPLVLKRLAESGDIRSAVSSLEFLCLRGDSEEIWSSKVTFTKQKKSKSEPALTQSEEEALKLISNRESTLGIFHAVGKVVYNKRVSSSAIINPPPWLPQHVRRKPPENDVNELIDELGTDTSTFLAALHENYALSCSSPSQNKESTLDSLSACMNSISDADLLSVDRFAYGTRAFSGSGTDSLRQDEMAFQVSVRGLWFNLPYPVQRTAAGEGNKRDANQMFYPASLKLWRRREEVEGVLQVLASELNVARSLVDGAVSDGNGAASSGSGVEAWKWNNTFASTSSDPVPENSSREISNSAKTEMLLERLPFVAQILSRKKLPPSSKLLERLNTVTRVRSSGLDGDQDEDEDEEDETNGAEQWNTDRPDVESTPKSRKGKPSPAKVAETLAKPKLTEGGGLGIPVENRVEKLVLEDDDIED